MVSSWRREHSCDQCTQRPFGGTSRAQEARRGRRNLRVPCGRSGAGSGNDARGDSPSSCATRSFPADPGSADPPDRPPVSAARGSGSLALEEGAERRRTRAAACGVVGCVGGRGRAPRRPAAHRPSTRPRPRARRLRAARERSRSRPACRRARRTTSCGATVPFQWFSFSRQATSKRPSARSRSSCEALAERDGAPGVVPMLAHAEAEVLSLAHGARARRPGTRDEQRHIGVAESERGEPVELLREREREILGRDDRVHDRPGTRSSSASIASACAANASANASRRSGSDREAGRCAVAAEALEVLGAGGERAVQVEAPGPSARSLSTRRRCRRRARRVD